MNKADVLKVAGECGIGTTLSNYWSDELECFAKAMIAVGAEGMRERAAHTARQLEDDYLEHRIFPEEYDMTQAAAACGSCANIIRALPITQANPEGEKA